MSTRLKFKDSLLVLRLPSPEIKADNMINRSLMYTIDKIK